VTLNSGLWSLKLSNRHGSIRHLWLPINVPWEPLAYRTVSKVDGDCGGCKIITYLESQTPSFLFTVQLSLSFSDQSLSSHQHQLLPRLIHLLQSTASLLETNDFVIVYALDFSKTFDKVRHSTVLSKLSLLDILDSMYNCIESFSREHWHCTKCVRTWRLSSSRHQCQHYSSVRYRTSLLRCHSLWSTSGQLREPNV